MSFTLFLAALYENLGHMLHYIEERESLILGLSTIVLVVVTYAALREAANNRKDVRLPIVKCDIKGPIDTHHPDKQYLSFHAENIGYGLALDVELDFMYADLPKVRFGTVEPGAKKHFNMKIAEEKLEEIRAVHQFTDVMVLRYKDVFGRSIKTEVEIFDENADKQWIDLAVKSWKVDLPD